MTKKAWKPQDSPDHNAALRVAAIVGALFLMPPEVLFRSTRGGAPEAYARLIFYWTMHVGAGMSLSRVATAAAGRDRSSVSSGVRRIEEQMSDPGFSTFMEKLAALARDVVEMGALQDDAIKAQLTQSDRPRR